MPELLDLYGKTSKAVQAATDAALRRHGLRLGQDHLLAELWATDGLTPGEVAALVGVTTPAVTKTATVLANAGLLVRRPDARDRRLVRLWLTAAGRALQGPVEDERRRLDDALSGALTATERELLMTTLATVRRVATDLLSAEATPRG
ncbi:MarR family winged helix-turn-helix transcriptional regulator [Nakamurella lactea]|uniref:MarR family winged helix-turn-helix transcriptional regulator n=1 Tax=Nakamurella lactea TaxID=459515 RepID=UPI000416F15F|nr:MarR family transcriptional regulator [Nakamurella lactea]